jgi:hypothetical protein
MPHPTPIRVGTNVKANLFVVRVAGRSCCARSTLFGTTRAIPAIFDAGVFRPLEPVNLAEGTRADVIPLPQSTPSSQLAPVSLPTWPPGYFEQTSGVLAGEDFERSPQGDLPQREEW